MFQSGNVESSAVAACLLRYARPRCIMMISKLLPLAVTGWLAPSLVAADLTLHSFKKQHLEKFYWSEGAAFGDLNRDGKPDAISGPYWWEGPGFTKRHEIYAPAKTTTDSLIYVTEGPIIFHQEKEMMEVNPGDFIREEAGLTHIWEQVHDGGFVTTTGFPVVPKK